MEKNETVNPVAAFKMHLKVHLSSGGTNDHIVDVPTEREVGKATVIHYFNLIKKVVNGKGKQFYLPNPNIFYNPTYIVFIQVELIGPDEWQELIDQSLKGPVGFRH